MNFVFATFEVSRPDRSIDSTFLSANSPEQSAGATTREPPSSAMLPSSSSIALKFSAARFSAPE